jgi:hypothetical protein
MELAVRFTAILLGFFPAPPSTVRTCDTYFLSFFSFFLVSNEGSLPGNWKTCTHAENVNLRSKKKILRYTQTNREARWPAGIYISKCIHKDGQTGRLRDELLNGYTSRQRDI